MGITWALVTVCTERVYCAVDDYGDTESRPMYIWKYRQAPPTYPNQFRPLDMILGGYRQKRTPRSNFDSSMLRMIRKDPNLYQTVGDTQKRLLEGINSMDPVKKSFGRLLKRKDFWSNAYFMLHP